MRHRHLALLALLASWAWGCDDAGGDPDPEPAAPGSRAPATEPEPPPAPEPEPEPPGRHTLVVTELRFSDLVEPGVAPGFDLDDAITSPGDRTGCGHTDLRSPDGAEGIDNQLATLMPVFRATEAAAVDGLLQEAVNGGLTLYLLQLDDLDSWTDDDAVELLIQASTGPTPILGTHGRIEADQTFELDVEATSNRATATLVDGTVTTERIALSLPATVLNESFEIDLPVGMVQLTFNPDGSADGIFGGAVRLEAILDLVAAVDTSIADLATTILQQRADLLPDAEGRCTAISAYWQFHAERAFVADW